MENSEQLKFKSWIVEVFEDRDFEIVKIEFPEYDATGGFAAEIVFANVIGREAGKEKCYQLILKKNKDNDVALNTLNLRQAYINEVYMYSEILPQFELLAKEKKSKPFENIPHCYGTINRDNSYVVIMENLKPRGYRTNTLEKPHDLDHVKLILKAYAKWHAFSFALKDQKPMIFDEIKKRSKTLFKREGKMYPILITSTRDELESVMQIYRDKNKSEIVPKLRELSDSHDALYGDFLAIEDGDYFVIRHGDCWNNNFMFHYNGNNSKPDNVVIIDWQIGGLCSPMSDVALYLFHCCSRPVLYQIDELLEFYYSNLSQKLIELGSDPEKCFPWNICLQSFEKYAPIGIAGAPVMAKMSQRDENTEFDITESLKDGSFAGIFGKELKDPEKYFERIDGIFEFCIDRGYI